METSNLSDYIMDTLCRICAEKSTNLTSIFESNLLPLKISKCLPIQVSPSDNLPLNVCDICIFKIDESYRLYETCLLADLKLNQIWKSLVKEPIITYPDGVILGQSNKCNNVEYISNEIIINCIDKESENLIFINQSQPIRIICQEEKIGDKTDDVDSSNVIISLPEEALYNEISASHKHHYIHDDLQDASSYENAEAENKHNNESEDVHTEKETDEVIAKDDLVLDEKGKSEKSSTRQNPKQYQCRFCTRQLSTSSSMSIHESTHSKEKPYLCDSCGKSFKHANNLRSHVRTHLGIRKKFTCKLCSKSFLTNFFLREHMNVHTGETPYKCSECGKEFREKIHLRQHKWTHSGSGFECSTCGKKFNRKGNMTEHVKKFHGDKRVESKTAAEETNIISHRCSVCSEVFANENSFKSHLKAHSNPQSYFCSICGKKFRHSGSLTYHRRTAHTGERPFQCNYCDEKFSLRSVQRIHERKQHTFERPYKCNFCSRLFTNSSSLRNHAYVHAEEKSFECNECGKKFARRSNLQVHEKLHSNDRQYVCDECGKRYVQKHDMMKHKKVHDSKTKPFFCKFCGNSFSRKKDFVKHAMCRTDYSRKKKMDVCTAERILDSVSSAFQRDGDLLEAEELILRTVKRFSDDHDKDVVRNLTNSEV